MDTLTTPARALPSDVRVTATGKFLFAGDRKLYVRGTTYGTFRPDESGRDFPSPATVRRDLAAMAARGFNAVRVYTVPPASLLDTAARSGMRVLVGIPWEQHLTFFDDADRVRSIEEKIRAGVRACAGHPAVLGYAIGNEIPASIVRWGGRRRVERHLRRLCEIARSEDPDGLVTYANFPSTEYLDLPFLDLVCFNVYLEKTARLTDYVARLQNLAGDRPLLLGELGLDSRRNGEEGQARTLDHQVRAAFRSGCAGLFVFAWTDEWHRGGHDVDDWDFGLTTRDRAPKPALPAVQRAFAESPFSPERAWPRVSVVVCVHDGEATLDGCLEGLARLEYPDYEVIVVDDGSTDRSAEIAARHPVRLIRTENRGLSRARNTGLAAASGEIVAYVDADARADAHWLHYLVEALRDDEHVGVGGPNLPCPEDGDIADCVANAPGGPIHVLLSDREAEHVPGCNMAFRKRALEAIDGFDPQFRAAGDDVDLCWRLQARGWKLAFSPSAVVWHHRRNSVRAYWRQQEGYGRAEALLEAKWPEKYNAAGHVTWGGRIYGQALLYALSGASRIYHGTWGTAPFQSRHLDREPSVVGSLAAAPEWYLVLAALAGLSLLGMAWSPLLLALPLLVLAAGASLWRAVRGGAVARFSGARTSEARQLGKRALTALLYLIQPAARLRGRLSRGLTPWRFRSGRRFTVPAPREISLWSERWRSTSERLEALERRLKRKRAVVMRGGPYDRWDLEVRVGAAGIVRLCMCVEDHGGGRQLVHFRVWPGPRASHLGWALPGGPMALAAGAAIDGAWGTAGVLGILGGVFLVRIGRQCGAAMALVVEQLRDDRWGEIVLTEDRPRSFLRRGRRPYSAREADVP